MLRLNLDRLLAQAEVLVRAESVGLLGGGSVGGGGLGGLDVGGGATGRKDSGREEKGERREMRGPTGGAGEEGRVADEEKERAACEKAERG